MYRKSVEQYSKHVKEPCPTILEIGTGMYAHLAIMANTALKTAGKRPILIGIESEMSTEGQAVHNAAKVLNKIGGNLVKGYSTTTETAKATLQMLDGKIPSLLISELIGDIFSSGN
mgnify:CR=1 FL=1